ncbi:NUDIX hydrolase [Kitasatospora sp. GP82]|uniref:NUDIX hydrolase n=1 Tax=Kitasatospora sp. GP82 TaxID=3035089 RepID=UPI0024748EC8|nr:NUDIX hydrolase [Kitasatospora sp. GP82]MDH6123460.1 ADP-ribose pyrophosphatase YjhB (NUDIX family) [Kitasatospora sp. GP82]
MTHDDNYFTNPPSCRLGALAVFLDEKEGDDAGVLIVRKVYKDAKGNPFPWGLVGGSVLGHERISDGWSREIGEETGFTDVEPGELLVVDDVPASNGYAKGVNFVFFGGRIKEGTPITLPADELSEYKFVSRRDWAEYLSAHDVRRVGEALNALTTGHTVYLVHGHKIAAVA